MGGIVELLNRNGSMLAVAQHLLGKDMSRRRAGLGAFAMGWVVFFELALLNIFITEGIIIWTRP